MSPKSNLQNYITPQYKFTSYYIHVSCYGETDRHLKVRSGKNIAIFPLTFKNVKPPVENSRGDHLVLYNHYPPPLPPCTPI